MPAYDPSELIAICDSILEDGELSGREVYRLSQWLNENPEACRHWPGNLLVQPLKTAWADSTLTTTELHDIARVLLRIHKDWADQHAADEPPKDAPRLSPDFVRAINLKNARLPAVEWSTVIGRADAGHTVDLRSPSCTCADWQSNRSKLPIGHLSRCCRHILQTFAQVKPASGWPGWLGAFLSYGWTPHPQKNWMAFRVPATNSLVLASTAPIDWADVFALDDGEYERFGYHVSENRWAYDRKPADTDRISQRINLATRLAQLPPHLINRVKIKVITNR